MQGWGNALINDESAITSLIWGRIILIGKNTKGKAIKLANQILKSNRLQVIKASRTRQFSLLGALTVINNITIVTAE